MQLNPHDIIHGFKITERSALPEIDGESIIGIHEESGARLLCLKNDDNNKSFAIGFRTPPQDNTGVFHILEHSVLCGSRRYPVKEPFVDLLKSSMQTFLNAMTFADKTLYPVASTNEQDLFNLMDVYLDAVFHPRIYEKKAIFEQEGWHYELKRAASAASGETAETGNVAELDASQTTLVHNGVVFNEMKGALSDSSSVLYDELQTALFPDTCYAFESGGTPQAIPTLTYENYLDEHRRHYRTNNSYIILYGNLDIDRALAFLDERYLTPVAAEQHAADDERARAGLEPLAPRPIEMQAPLKAPYLRKTMDTAPENAVAACGYVIGDAADRVRETAAEILLDALFGSNEAPLKRALLDAGIAHDVHAFVSDALLQPFAVVQISMPAEGAGAELQETITREVRALLERGLDKQLIEAAISHAEFIMREHDMSYADGVIYSMVALSSWLYDDDAVTDYLRYEQTYAELRASLESDYYERLCTELFLDNDHTASVEIEPTPGHTEDDMAEALARMNLALSPEERAHIVAEEAILRELQEAPDSPEATATLPRLGVADIEEAPDEPAFELDGDAPIPCLRHSVSTHGIAYAYRYFDLNCLAFDELPYLSVLALILGKLDTASHTAAQIDTLVQGKLGNLTLFTDVYENRNDIAGADPKLVISASSLANNTEWLATLPREIMLETDFGDTGKILDVLKQRKIMLEQSFASAGHQCAAARCKSYYSTAGVIREQLGNVGFYQFLCELIDHFDDRAESFIEKLSDISARVFCDDNCLMSFAGSEDEYARFWQADPTCGRNGEGAHILEIPNPVMRNEAFIVPSDVCYAAMGWDSRLIEQSYNGTWAVAGRALSLDYLWNEVRVKGGAYGVGFQSLRTGNMRFYSYRDPHLDETLARFANSATWLASYEPSHEEFEGFVVASVAPIDAPRKPRELIRRQAGDYIAKRSREERLQTRREIIAADLESVRSFAEALAQLAEAGALCVFGNREILESSQAGFKLVNLVG